MDASYVIDAGSTMINPGLVKFEGFPLDCESCCLRRSQMAL